VRQNAASPGGGCQAPPPTTFNEIVEPSRVSRVTVPKPEAVLLSLPRHAVDLPRKRSRSVRGLDMTHCNRQEWIAIGVGLFFADADGGYWGVREYQRRARRTVP